MGTFLRLAWRNLTRNLRRTALTTIALTFSLIVLVVSVSFGNGYHQGMLINAINRQTSHIQLHRTDFLDRLSLSLFYEHTDWLDKAIRATPNVDAFAHRVRGEAIIQPEASTLARHITVLAIDPIKEQTVTDLKTFMKDPTRYPAETTDPNATAEIVIGEKLAEKLKVTTGKNVLLRSGSVGPNATGQLLLRIRGLYSSGDGAMDENIVFIHIDHGRALFGYNDIHTRQGPAITETVIKLTDRTLSETTAPELEKNLSAAFMASPLKDMTMDVKTWNKLLENLVQFIKLDEAFMWVLLAIIFLVVGFIILNSVFMSVFERIKEFGIILALGVKPRELVMMVMFETALLGLFALVIGGLTSGAIYYYMMTNGIDLSASAEAAEYMGGGPAIIHAAMTWNEAYVCGIGLVILSIGSGIYPAVRASRIPIVEAIRFSG